MYVSDMNYGAYPKGEQFKGEAFWEVLRLSPSTDEAILADDNRKHAYYICPVRGGDAGFGICHYRGPNYQVTTSDPGTKPIAGDLAENHGDDTANILYFDGTVLEVKKGTADWDNADQNLIGNDPGGIPINIKPEEITVKPEDDINKILEQSLNDLKDPSKQKKAESVLVGFKEKSIESLVDAFNKEQQSYQSLDKEIKELLPQLGVDEWETRDKAQKRLEDIGNKAIPFLKEIETKTNDPETRSRASVAQKNIKEQRYSKSELARREFITSLLNIMGNIGSLKQPALQCFAEMLSDNDHCLRRLSYEWLKKLTGKDLPFDYKKSAAEQEANIKAWKSLIEEKPSK